MTRGLPAQVFLLCLLVWTPAEGAVEQTAAESAQDRQALLLELLANPHTEIGP